MSRSTLRLLVAPAALIFAVACSSPQVEPDHTKVAPPSIVINAPVDQVLKVVTTEPYAAKLLASDPSALQKSATVPGEAWLNKGVLDFTNTHYRAHFLPISATQTSVSLGIYDDAGAPNMVKVQANDFMDNLLKPLKTYMENGQKGATPSLLVALAGANH